MKEYRYSIILPVRNGGEYIKLCVQSILNQTYEDFNLEILENCSTDGTPEWLATLKDPRIRIWPASFPLSIEENWRRILEIPKNEYMTMIGHDDLLDANYLSVIDDLIEKYPDASLYQAHFRIIDANGATTRRCLPMPERETAADFLAARFANIRDSFGTGHMMRSKDYERVGGIPSYPKLLYADDALWLMLMESSWKVTSREECFAYRLHSASTSGTPDPSSLFAALEQYACFLEQLNNKKNVMVIKTYGPSYMMRFCKAYYQWLLENACYENKIMSEDKLSAINNLMKKFSLNSSLIIDSSEFSILKWISEQRGAKKKYLYYLWKRGNKIQLKTVFKKMFYYYFKEKR